MSTFDRACRSLRYWMLRAPYPDAPNMAAHYAKYVMRLARKEGRI